MSGTAPGTAPDAQPIRYDRPSTTLGNNLSYAFQWWFFAAGAQVAWLLLARREADDREDELLLGLPPGGVPGGASVHRRGTPPNVVETDAVTWLALADGSLGWAEAVAHATCLPADVLGFAHKGRMRAGCDADLVIFDPEAIADRADFPGMGCPNAVPAGIAYVIVGGEVAAQNGKTTGVMAGRALRC